MVSKLLYVSVVFLVINTNIYANYERYPLELEYRLVNACIDKNSSRGVTKTLRNECISKVEGLEKKFVREKVESLDNEGKLKDLF